MGKSRATSQEVENGFVTVGDGGDSRVSLMMFKKRLRWVRRSKTHLTVIHLHPASELVVKNIQRELVVWNIQRETISKSKLLWPYMFHHTDSFNLCHFCWSLKVGFYGHYGFYGLVVCYKIQEHLQHLLTTSNYENIAGPTIKDDHQLFDMSAGLIDQWRLGHICGNRSNTRKTTCSSQHLFFDYNLPGAEQGEVASNIYLSSVINFIQYRFAIISVYWAASNRI